MGYIIQTNESDGDYLDETEVKTITEVLEIVRKELEEGRGVHVIEKEG